MGYRTTTVYDSYGRVTETRRPDGTITTIVYDDVNHKQTEIAQDSTRTTTVFDAQGHVLNVFQPSGAITTYLYDNAGHQTAVIAPGEPWER